MKKYPMDRPVVQTLVFALVALCLGVFIAAIGVNACKAVSAPSDAESGIAETEAGQTTPPPIPIGTPTECVSLTGIDSSGTLTAICATIEEIAQLVVTITNLRALTDAGSPAGCTIVPQTNLCASPSEVSKGIRFIQAKRKALLTIDAGSR